MLRARRGYSGSLGANAPTPGAAADGAAAFSKRNAAGMLQPSGMLLLATMVLGCFCFCTTLGATPL